MRAGRRPLLGPLGRRLAAGSVVIAFASIALLVAVTLLVFDLDIGSASHEPEDVYTAAVVAGLRSAYVSAGGWKGADLAAPVAIAELEGFGLTVHSGGRTVLSVESPSPGAKPAVERVVVAGRVVGTVSVSGPASGLTPAEASLRHNLVHAVEIAALLAALLAVLVALAASRSLVAPIQRLTAAAARLGAGDRSSRVGHLKAPGELDRLARTFDLMADRLAQTDQLRRDLVADVAHELRTPVAVLRAELEAVSVGIHELTPATIDSLSEEVDRLAGLVEDLGVLASAEAAGLSLELSAVDLAEVAAEAADRLAWRFAEKEIALERSLTPCVVLGDGARLEQVAVNLLSNVAKFSPRGSAVRMSVTTAAGCGVLAVSDEGPGIPAEEQPMVFERFFRGVGASRGSGSGIGLAVVAAIVGAHGGAVRLESEPGEGSTFTVSLPLFVAGGGRA